MRREFVPHAPQREAMAHVFDLERLMLWAPMGGGKTSLTLTALQLLDMVEETYPALIIAPLRVARKTWPDEVEKWVHLKGLRVSKIIGNAAERRAALNVQADLYTINYDNLPWLVETLGEAWPFKTIVADEVTRLQGFRLRQGSKRAGALAKRAFRSRRFIGLTGTPATKGVINLWGQLWFIDQGARLGRTYSAFEARWFTKGWDGFSVVPVAGAEEQIMARIKDVCITIDGLPVDEPILNPIYVDLPPAVRRTYAEMETELFTLIEEGGVEAANAAVKSGKLHQIANGAVYTSEDRKEWAELHNAKLDALESVIEEANGAPVLVSYSFKHDLARLKKRFPQGREFDSDEVMDLWNQGKVPLLFAHPKSAGHGLSLAEGGNILAFFSIDWNLEEHMQIIERIGPMRQAQAGIKRPVFLHLILAQNTVDELILERQTSRRSVQEIMLEAARRRRTK